MHSATTARRSARRSASSTTRTGRANCSTTSCCQGWCRDPGTVPRCRVGVRHRVLRPGLPRAGQAGPFVESAHARRLGGLEPPVQPGSARPLAAGGTLVVDGRCVSRAGRARQRAVRAGCPAGAGEPGHRDEFAAGQRFVVGIWRGRRAGLGPADAAPRGPLHGRQPRFRCGSHGLSIVPELDRAGPGPVELCSAANAHAKRVRRDPAVPQRRQADAGRDGRMASGPGPVLLRQLAGRVQGRRVQLVPQRSDGRTGIWPGVGRLPGGGAEADAGRRRSPARHRGLRRRLRRPAGCGARPRDRVVGGSQCGIGRVAWRRPRVRLGVPRRLAAWTVARLARRDLRAVR